MIFVAAAVLIGIAGTVSGKGCCTPDQWEGNKYSQAGYNGKKPGFVEGGDFISYDATNKRVASTSSYTSFGKTRKYNIVVLYSEESAILKWCVGENCGVKGKMYVVDLQNDKCYVKKVRKPFRKACIPDNAHSSGKFMFGAGNKTLEVESFNVKKDSLPMLYVEAWLTMADGCIPVVESIHGSVKGVGFMETVGFANITPGIKDPAVFDIPEQCKKNATDAPFPDDIQERSFSILAL